MRTVMTPYRGQPERHTSHKSWGLLITAALRISLGVCVSAAMTPAGGLAQSVGRPGTAALDFHARTLGPSPVEKSLADYRGKVVVLTIWATWCRDCHDELASLQRLYAKYEVQGLRIVAVSIDRGKSDQTIRDYMQAIGATFDVLRDEDNEILDNYLLRGPPSVLVIDRFGIIRRRNIGAVDWDVDPRLAQIKQLLAEPSPVR
jgi:cytochrome c biogenesis protein CcmG/thiol:disulfide interchange protein DsbE